MNKKIKENYKLLVGFIIGGVIFGTIGVTAEQQIESTGVTYTTKTGKVETVNKTLDNLIALSDTFTTDFKTSIKKEILNETYPVGSIYMSTVDNTKEKVAAKFGGTWARYSQDTTLVGYKENGVSVNTTGGSKTATLAANLPSHNHTLTPSGTISSTFSSGLAASNGEHAHSVSLYNNHAGYGTTIPGTHGYIVGNTGALWTQEAIPNMNVWLMGYSNPNGAHTHSVTGTVTSTFTGTKGTTSSTGTGNSFNVQDPYTVVYMYIRTN